MLLFLTPPFVQLNTPYPATPSLVGFLTERGYECTQRDLSIEVALEVLRTFGDEFTDEAIEILQNPHLGADDKVEMTAYIDELAIWIRDNVDPDFGFSRYAERLGVAVPDFGAVLKRLRKHTAIDKMLERRVAELLEELEPDIVGVTCPFPGTLLGAFRIAQVVKKLAPHVQTVLGGGYVNTELRDLDDDRVGRFFDAVMYDEGYAPWLEFLYNSELRIKNYELGNANSELRIKNYELGMHGAECEGQTHNPHCECEVSSHNRHCEERGAPRAARDVAISCERGAESSVESQIPPFVRPSYKGLDMSLYMDLPESENPMHRLWSTGRWIKIQMARGCYWHKCAFCDVTLDYIKCFQMPDAVTIVDAMESLVPSSSFLVPSCQSPISDDLNDSLNNESENYDNVQETKNHELGTRNHQLGTRNYELGTKNLFHFTDEAMPPALIEKMCREIIRRKFKCRWWGNVRFDTAFTPRLAKLMAKAGCIAVTGGLECATDRLLKLMNKGITLASARSALTAFRDAGIMVHSYLMYGFPTQTEREAMSALGTVRRFFKENLIQSAFFHRFALTVHSPIAREPDKFGIIVPSSLFLVPSCSYIPEKHESGSGNAKRETNHPELGTRNCKLGTKKIFARNEIPFEEPGAPDWDRIGKGLKLALYNYMRGAGYSKPLSFWFANIDRE